MHKRLFAIIASVALTVLPSAAQISSNIMSVLDNCASTIKKCGNVKATFTAGQYINKEEQGSSNGTICISGSKLYINAGQSCIWYDGKTQWSYSASTQEVNISTPSKSEAAAMNPYSFISLYKQGYCANMSDATVRGKNCHEVNLTATGKKTPKFVYLTIDKATMLPICIRTSNNGKEWTKISVYDISKKQKFNTDTFRFNAGDFPGAEVIDLR